MRTPTLFRWSLRAMLLVGTSGMAREFWLEPARFFVRPGASVHLRRLVGQNFRGEAWAGKSNRVVRLLHFAPGAAPANLLPLAATPDTLATTLTLRQPGTHLVALATNEAFTTLSPPDFTAYLQAHGFDHVLAQRQQRKQQQLPGREAYRRCAKTLIQVGFPTPTDTARAWSRTVGLPLELVPEQNPVTLPAGAGLTVRVLSDGRPLAGQPVLLWRRNATPRALLSTLRSNQNGRVLLRISGPGEYLVSSVRMVAAPAGQATDWVSTWTTLTFSVAPQKRLE